MRLNSFVTPLTIGLGAVVFISGFLMFFGVKTRPIHGVHEYIGALFALIVVLHLIDHKKSAAGYFKKRRSIALIAASAAFSAVFFAAVPEAGGGENAAKTIMEKTLDAPLGAAARLFNLSEENAIERLAGGGVSVSGAEESLRSIAAKNGVRPELIVEKLAR
jgi:hypothetical protein